jgi:hypothetical protein
LLVLSPEAFQLSSFDFVVTADDRVQINVVFNKPVDTSTVIPGASLILETEGNPNADVTVTWSTGNTVLTIVTVDKHCEEVCGFVSTLFLHSILMGHQWSH